MSKVADVAALQGKVIMMTLHRFRHHILDRCIDVVLDSRLPHALPYTLWRTWRYPNQIQSVRCNAPVNVCLTFDIEHNFREPASTTSAKKFLDVYLNLASQRRWRSTLYTQGSLVPALAKLLREATVNHEIGLHGLYHEVWGRSRWWQYRLGLIGISNAEKKARLQRALELFADAELPRPRSFRAPYLNADSKTLQILVEAGFCSDSSPAAYLGVLPILHCRDGLWQIPVTTNPRPERQGSLARYPEMTLGSLVSMSSERLVTMITGALALQGRIMPAAPPHLVLLAHPWEFETTAGVAYASDSNWQCLQDVIQIIADHFPIVFSTISDVIDQLHS